MIIQMFSACFEFDEGVRKYYADDLTNRTCSDSNLTMGEIPASLRRLTAVNYVTYACAQHLEICLADSALYLNDQLAKGHLKKEVLTSG